MGSVGGVGRGLLRRRSFKVELAYAVFSEVHAIVVGWSGGTHADALTRERGASDSVPTAIRIIQITEN